MNNDENVASSQDKHTDRVARETVDRVAQLARYDSEPVGICIFIGADELRSLGIDPNLAQAIRYHIETDSEVIALRKAGEQGGAENTGNGEIR